MFDLCVLFLLQNDVYLSIADCFPFFMRYSVGSAECQSPFSYPEEGRKYIVLHRNKLSEIILVSNLWVLCLTIMTMHIIVHRVRHFISSWLNYTYSTSIYPTITMYYVSTSFWNRSSMHTYEYMDQGQYRCPHAHFGHMLAHHEGTVRFAPEHTTI